MIYFTSDIHMGHNKDFLYGPRGFNSTDEHDEAIIKNWNDTVSDEDIIYVLGDSLMGNQDTGIEKLKRLNGRIIFIRGNHDTDNKTNRYVNELGWKCIGYSAPLVAGGYHFYLSHYPSITSNYDIEKPLERRVINLCGHTHTKDKFQNMNIGLCYHCELDAHNNKPVSIDEVISDIRNYIDE